MSLSNEQILIDYLDNRLEGEERLKVEQLIQADAAAAQELEVLRFSVELIREAGVVDQVATVRKSYEGGAKVVAFEKQEGGAVVRSMSKNIMRIAVMVLLVLGAGSVYKYTTTTASSVYEQNFVGYEMETSRGTNNDGNLEKAYRNKNWASVETIFKQQEVKSTQSCFLAGMAEMELKNYDKAIIYFHEVMNLNKNSAEQYYQDETEYYLAMAYLGAGKVSDGVAILRQIRGNKDHLFYKRVSRISAIDLKTLELKK